MLEGLKKELSGIDLGDPDIDKMIKEIEAELSDQKDGDEVVGVMDEETIKLNVRVFMLRQQAVKMLEEHKLAVLHAIEQKHDITAACKTFDEMFGKHHIMIHLLQNMIWEAIRLDHGLINEEIIAFCKGWKIVKRRPEPRDRSGLMIELLTMSGHDSMDDMLPMLAGQTPSRRRRGIFGR